MSEIETVYSTDWIQGFQCEAMGYIGRDEAGKFYYAWHISPHQDEQNICWHGPCDSREEADAGMQGLSDGWYDTDSEKWQEWEDRQIAEFERKPIG